MPSIPNHLTYRFLYGHMPQQEAMSQYVAVNNKGVTYHLFNAKRMPVGRMAVLISQYIRGKHKPGYEENNFKNGDKCVVVNMADPLMTGRKRQLKIYRHHTGFPGGLKEITFKEMREKDPERILERAVLGMLPKNSLREKMIKENLVMFKEPYHNYGNILPQFTEPIPGDINDDLGFNNMTPENTIIQYTSNGEVPEEFKDFPMEIDDTIDIPMTIRKKTHTNHRWNFKLGNAMR
jgi:large subunit ribosomal protein L13